MDRVCGDVSGFLSPILDLGLGGFAQGCVVTDFHDAGVCLL